MKIIGTTLAISGALWLGVVIGTPGEQLVQSFLSGCVLGVGLVVVRES